MMTRKELLGSLMSKGVVVTNPLFENEDLEDLNNQVKDILDSYCDDDEDCCDDEEVEEVDVKEEELIGKEEDGTEVVHVLYPGAEQYPLLMAWAERMKEEYENVDVKYNEDLDAFIFFCGDYDKAVEIAEELIDELNEEEDKE